MNCNTCGGGNIWLIIILIILFGGFGCGNGFMLGNGCGCGCNCGCNNNCGCTPAPCC